jgi:hypothetical protein
MSVDADGIAGTISLETHLLLFTRSSIDAI